MTGLTKAVVCTMLSGMVHIKEPLLLISRSSTCGGNGFPLVQSELFFTMLSASLSKTFLSFLPYVCTCVYVFCDCYQLSPTEQFIGSVGVLQVNDLSWTKGLTPVRTSAHDKRVL